MYYNSSQICFFNIKIKYVLVSIFIFFYQSLISQDNNINIAGNLTSIDTDYPISYANIYFTKNKGVSSDENGYYSITFNKEYLQELITISAIGFKKIVILASDLLNNPNIKMEEDIFNLEEVVITPLNAFPILSKVSKRAKYNYKTGRVSSDFIITQAILFFPFSDSTKTEFLALSKIKGKINYKGDVKSSTKIKFDSIYETSSFQKYDALSEISKNRKPTNFYKFFNEYEAYRKIHGLQENNPNLDKNVFNAKLYRNNKSSKVIDFQDLDNRPNYIVSTSVANFNVSKNELQAKFKVQKEKFSQRKEALKESLKYSPLYNNKDSLDKIITSAMIKPKVISKIDQKSYFWIDKENFLMTKHLSKLEYRRSDNNQLFNKVYYGFEYKLIEDKSLVSKIETLRKRAKNINGTFYNYTQIIFLNHKLGKQVNIIPKQEILDEEYNKKPIIKDRILLKNEIDTILSQINNNFFIKPMEKRDNELVEFYKNY